MSRRSVDCVPLIVYKLEVTFTLHPGGLKKSLKLDEHGLDACAVAVKSRKRRA